MRGTPSPRAYCVRRYPFQRGLPPQRPRRIGPGLSGACSAYPATRPSRRLRLHNLPPAQSEDRNRTGIPPRSSGRANCLRDRLVAGPEPHDLPPPISVPLWGRRCLRGCHEPPHNKALSSPVRPLIITGLLKRSHTLPPSTRLAFHFAASCVGLRTATYP
jgi:hypothetical protein